MSADPLSLPGLQCTIHFEDDIYNTNAGDYVYWNIETFDNGKSNEIVEGYTTVDILNTAPTAIENAKWIWNYKYKNKSYVKEFDSITFKFSFGNVQNIQNKPGDDCGSISYYPPNKWKTNKWVQCHRLLKIIVK